MESRLLTVKYFSAEKMKLFPKRWTDLVLEREEIYFFVCKNSQMP